MHDDVGPWDSQDSFWETVNPRDSGSCLVVDRQYAKEGAPFGVRQVQCSLPIANFACQKDGKRMTDLVTLEKNADMEKGNIACDLPYCAEQPYCYSKNPPLKYENGEWVILKDSKLIKTSFWTAATRQGCAGHYRFCLHDDVGPWDSQDSFWETVNPRDTGSCLVVDRQYAKEGAPFGVRQVQCSSPTANFACQRKNTKFVDFVNSESMMPIELDWSAAQFYCCSIGMRLVSAQSYEKLACLQGFLEENTEYWTSGTNSGCENNRFRWCSTEFKDFVKRNEYFNENLPRNATSSENNFLPTPVENVFLYKIVDNEKRYPPLIAASKCARANGSLLAVTESNIASLKILNKFLRNVTTSRSATDIISDSVLLDESYMDSKNVTWAENMKFCCSIGMKPIRVSDELLSKLNSNKIAYGSFYIFDKNHNSTEDRKLIKTSFWTAATRQGCIGHYRFCMHDDVGPWDSQDGFWETVNPRDTGSCLVVDRQYATKGAPFGVRQVQCSSPTANFACQKDDARMADFVNSEINTGTEFISVICPTVQTHNIAHLA
ncbi:Hypothetical predicted protein [Cloeon dipterum]|uniref:C-type lectin domain-containing protein n=1 Tax=Cloeon dipterum TaxID=197152 RepID=A0A8S1E6L8_9INSE|nr:Hypothetical predicted protein [Cloeon dipterum]